MLGVVDFDMKFTYVLAGCKGSAHDATIQTEAKFYLADVGYACPSSFLPSFRSTQGTTSISSLQGSTQGMPSNSSISHILLIVTVERAFAALNKTF
jgi:hypothetical protein